MNEYAIIVAGGTGSRMKSEVPKQFIPIKGKAILLHTIEKFIAYNSNIKIIVSCHKDYIMTANQLMEKTAFHSQVKIIEGGETRFHSVKNGLDTIEDLKAFVGIHDAARPLVSKETLERCFSMAKEKGNAVPVVALSESIRQVIGDSSIAEDRNRFRIVQTPQCFSVALIKKAFEQEYSNLFTDDATVAEKMGLKINLVEGNPENIKITHPMDLIIAETLLR
ncbi:MAG: 2-C-methyl-D-erythritol 4-phosphate cytidylyltransferase [Bacteroidota bacterium]|nr:2-C-methyl-D-erythritol 4-phosphate cytidylyltransferase [Bacteroidota bacterium]